MITSDIIASAIMIALTSAFGVYRSFTKYREIIGYCLAVDFAAGAFMFTCLYVATQLVRA